MSKSIGDRMKGYETAAQTTMPWRMPVIVRVDGKAFHTWTRGLESPFSQPLIEAMNGTAVMLCQEMQGAQVAYVQSDEISILLHNHKRLASQPWLDNRVQKICSIAASIATAAFNLRTWELNKMPAYFDARVFVLPEAEVTNYFLWRQQDATRNSIQMLARSMLSHGECHMKNTDELQEMCFQKGHNWNDLATERRRGRCIVREPYEHGGATRSRWVPDKEIPKFVNDGREYIERLLEVDES